VCLFDLSLSNALFGQERGNIRKFKEI
jgi:hypothetical protein